MLKTIYVKYGELTLKGKNRKQFTNCLHKNIKFALKDFLNIKIIKKYDCLLVEDLDEENYNSVFKILLAIPGISSVIESYSIDRKMDLLHQFIKEKLEEYKHLKTFRISTKRIDKKFELDSMEFSKKMGGFVLDNFENFKVQMNHVDLNINIEIKEKNFVVFFNKHKGCGGFPLGINGKVLVLLSGGIDSPVASHLLMKKGLHVDFLTFISPPHTSVEAHEKVKTLIKKLTLDYKLEKPKLFTCEFTNLQHEIAHITNHRYQITIMRRYFFKIAQELATKYGYMAIATGESLGQVASQTLESMTTISSVLKDSVVLRPLLTYDKQEIIQIAKNIDTYETSILPYADACSLFVPANPVTMPDIKTAVELEQELMLGEDIYQQILEKHITKIEFN